MQLGGRKRKGSGGWVGGGGGVFLVKTLCFTCGYVQWKVPQATIKLLLNGGTLLYQFFSYAFMWHGSATKTKMSAHRIMSMWRAEDPFYCFSLSKKVKKLITVLDKDRLSLDNLKTEVTKDRCL